MRATESYSKKRRTQAANARSRTRLQTAKDAGNTKRNRQFSNPMRLSGAWTLREFREFSRIPNWRPLALIRVRVVMCWPPPGFEQEETEGTEGGYVESSLKSATPIQGIAVSRRLDFTRISRILTNSQLAPIGVNSRKGLHMLASAWI